MMQTISMLGPPVTPNQLAWLDRGLRALADTGLDEEEKLAVILLVDAHVIGTVLFSISPDPTPPPGAGPGNAFRATLTPLLDQQRYPALLKAIEAGAFDDDDTHDTLFGFGLDGSWTESNG